MAVNGFAQLAAALVGGLIARAWGAEATFFVAAGVNLMAVMVMAPVREPPSTESRRRAPKQFLQMAATPLLLVTSGSPF